jgi:DNA-binding response OmpR family regulator
MRYALIVEHDPSLLEVQAAILKRAGYSVLPTCDSHHALKLAYQYKPVLALINDGLPGLGGDQLCWRIKQDPALVRTRIVMVSTGDYITDRTFLRRTGADAALAIPFLPVELMEVVDNLFVTLPQTGQLIS